MKCLNIISLFLLSFIILNCSKDSSSTNEPVTEEIAELTPEEPKQEIYFTLDVDKQYQTEENQDNWIILHDAQGILLDYLAFENGEQLIFQKRSDSIPDSFSVTLLKVQFKNLETCIGDATHDIETFPQIAKGSRWSVPNKGVFISENDTPEAIGKFELIVSDIPGNDGFQLFKSSSISTPRIDYTASGTVIPNASKTAMRLEFSKTDLFENTNYLVSIMDGDLNLKHKFFESPKLDEVVTFNFNEFQQYDSYAYLPPFPPNLFNIFRLVGQIKGENRKHDLGYLILQQINTDVQDPLPLGFLDQFDYYETLLRINFENFNYSYISHGPKPEIIFPDEPILDIANTEIANFEMSTDFEYIRKENAWRSPNSDSCSYTNWRIHSEKNNYPINLKVPQSITDQYELLQINDLELHNSNFFIQSDSYHDFISNKFEVTPSTNVIEEYTTEIISIFHVE